MLELKLVNVDSDDWQLFPTQTLKQARPTQEKVEVLKIVVGTGAEVMKLEDKTVVVELVSSTVHPAPSLRQAFTHNT